ncbi:MAG: YncE family protein [Pseudomonadales bacterium]|nr:YncE family protein [Pseudomonadales bacterium]
MLNITRSKNSLSSFPCTHHSRISHPFLFLLLLIYSTILSAEGFKSNPSRFTLWQTNAGGNDVHIYDIKSHQLIKRLDVGPQPHGIAYASEAKQVLITLEKKREPNGELIWVNPHNFEISHRLTICRKPQALAVTPDGKWIYIPCRDGHYWVIDGIQRKLVKKIHTGGLPHNTIISPDGHFAYLSPMGSPREVSIIDIKANHQLIGTLPFSNSLRPSALSADGHYFFQHVDSLNGFEVADIPSKTFKKRVHHENDLGIYTAIGPLGWLKVKGLNKIGFQRCHGLAIRPDQREVWSTCGRNLNIHRLSPPFMQTHTLHLPGAGYWLTFSPDSKLAFIALKDKQSVVVMDTTLKKIAWHYKAGEKPKRNIIVPSETL